MKKAPYTVCMFGTYDRNYTSNKLILQGLKQNGVEVVEVNAHIPVTRLDSQKDMTWFHLARRIFNKYKIFTEVARKWSDIRRSDVIYIGYPGHFDVLLAWPIAKLARKKIVFNPLLIITIGFAEEQGILNKQSLMGKAMKFAEKIVYACCDLVFADTPFQEKFLAEDFQVPKEKLKVLAIGADDQYYAYTPYINDSQKINVVYYGLYSPIHGVEYIIEAAHQLRNNPNIHFTMVGNGNTFSKNYQQAQKQQLKNMTFYHDTPLDQHPAIIQKADIFLGFLQQHPTVDRVIPNKVYQGLALNKVVLTAQARVIDGVFTHKKNIYTVKPADTQSLVDGILELQAHPKLRKTIATQGYALFVEKFSPKAVGKELLQHMRAITQ